MAAAGVRFLPDATVVTTRAGALPCKIVLHAVGPVYRDGKSGEQQALEYVSHLLMFKEFFVFSIPSV